MYLQPIQAMQESQVCISGDVAIHSGAAIAPGVLLFANEGSRIVIGAGVCIGMGAVLHAADGVLEVQDGVSIGAGVLLVGSGTIGTQSCIGPSSTLVNPSVSAQAIVPSGSLLGDHSRQVSVGSAQTTVEAESLNSAGSPEEDLWAVEVTEQEVIERKNIKVVRKAEENSEVPKTSNSVHGKAYVNDLLSTLLPNRANQISPS